MHYCLAVSALLLKYVKYLCSLSFHLTVSTNFTATCAALDPLVPILPRGTPFMLRGSHVHLYQPKGVHLLHLHVLLEATQWCALRKGGFGTAPRTCQRLFVSHAQICL